MLTGLTTLFMAHNLNKIRYPWKESIRSVMDVSDDVLVCECESTDGTLEDLKLLSFEFDKIVILRHPWGPKKDILPRIANFCIDHVVTRWWLLVDADEVLHEDSHAELKQLVDRSDIDRVSMRFTHFLGDFESTYPFMYSRMPRMARRDSPWRFDLAGDACAPSYGKKDRTVDSNVDLYHYGKVHVGRRREAAVKEYEFQMMYREGESKYWPDPRIVKAYKEGSIDYKAVNTDRSGKTDHIKPFTGRHPKFMSDYIQAAKQRDQANL